MLWISERFSPASLLPLFRRWPQLVAIALLVSISATVLLPTPAVMAQSTSQPAYETPFWLNPRQRTLSINLDKVLVPPSPGSRPIYTVQKQYGGSPQLQITFPGARLQPSLSARAFQLANGSSFGPVQLFQQQAYGQPYSQIVIPFQNEDHLEAVRLIPPNKANPMAIELQLPEAILSEETLSAARSFWDKVFNRGQENEKAATPGTRPGSEQPAQPVQPQPQAPSRQPSVLSPAEQAATRLAKQQRCEQEAKHPYTEVTGLNLDGEQITLSTDGHKTLSLQNTFTLTAPNRVVYDFAPARLADADVKRSLTGVSSRIRALRLAQFEKKTVRLVVETPDNQAFHLVYGRAGSQRVGVIPWLKETLPAWLGQQRMEALGNQNSLNKVGLGSVSGTASENRTYINLAPNSGQLDYWVHQQNNRLIVELANVPAPAKPIGFDTEGLPSVIRLVHGPAMWPGSTGSALVIETEGLPTNLAMEHPQQNPSSLLLSFESPTLLSQRPNGQQRQVKGLVVVDAGHGGKDQGASRNGVLEKTLNLQVAKLLEQELQKRGITVRMTRTTDKFLPLADISAFSNRVNPDVFVSIHHNASNSSAIYGLETYYYKSPSIPLAKAIHKRILDGLPVKDNNVRKAMFYVIHHTDAPAVLVELGYLSNSAELTRLQNPVAQQKAAAAIADGIVDYLKAQR